MTQMLRVSLSVATASALVIPGVLAFSNYFMSDSLWQLPFTLANMPGLLVAIIVAMFGIDGHNTHDPSLMVTGLVSAIFWASLFYYLLGKKFGKAS